MIYWEIFKANFIANILGYGGGPATIPLLEYEVVNRYEWFTVNEYSEMVALGNGLPGPIATKLAGYIGFEVGGYLDRKSTRLNSSHVAISYAVFCLKKKKKHETYM